MNTLLPSFVAAPPLPAAAAPRLDPLSDFAGVTCVHCAGSVPPMLTQSKDGEAKRKGGMVMHTDWLKEGDQAKLSFSSFSPLPPFGIEWSFVVDVFKVLQREPVQDKTPEPMDETINLLWDGINWPIEIRGQSSLEVPCKSIDRHAFKNIRCDSFLDFIHYVLYILSRMKHQTTKNYFLGQGTLSAVHSTVPIASEDGETQYYILNHKVTRVSPWWEREILNNIVHFARWHWLKSLFGRRER